jgi:hypothetical protein
MTPKPVPKWNLENSLFSCFEKFWKMEKAVNPF